MKIYLRTMLIAAMAISMVLSLSSCEKDNNEEVRFGTCSLKYEARGELLSIADIEISYYDENGTLRSETMTKALWEKKITYKNLPVKSGVKIIHKVKSKLPDGKSEFTFGNNCEFQLFLSNAIEALKHVIIGSMGGTIQTTVSAENLANMFKTNFDVNQLSFEITDKDIIKK